MADAGDSFFTRKSGARSEAKDAASSEDAKSAKMALNELDDGAADGLGDGAKGGGSSPPPPRASVGWGSDATALVSEQKDGEGGGTAAAGGESKRAGRRRKGSDAGATAGGGLGGKSAKNRHFDDDGESTGLSRVLADSENYRMNPANLGWRQRSWRSRTWRRRSASRTSRRKVRGADVGRSNRTTCSLGGG